MGSTIHAELWPLELKVQFRNRGKEFAVALESEGKKRIELTDCLGRKHVLEEQRIDLSGEKKTIVIDVYGRTRVLSTPDAERLLKSRRRDYLDEGESSPVGPVCPAKQIMVPSTKSR